MALPPVRMPVLPRYEGDVRKEEDYADFRAPLGPIAKGAAAFANETQAVAGGAVALGAEALRTVAPGFAKPALASARDWGLGVSQRKLEEAQQPRYQPTVARVEDIKLGEPGGVGRLGEWAAYQGTKGLLNVATMALGGAGGAAAGVGKVALKEGVKQFAKNEVAKVAAKKAAVTGGIAGGALTSFGMEGGESFAGGVASGTAPEAQVGPSLVVGALNAALDVVPAIAAAKYVGKSAEALKGLRETILKDADLSKKAVHLAKQVGKGAVAGVGAEGITEGLQELVQIAGDRWAKDTNIFDDLAPEQRSQILNAAAAGALTGGLLGGGAGAIRGGREIYARDEEQPAAEAGQTEAEAAPGQAPGTVPGPGEAGGAGAVTPSPAPAAEAAAKDAIRQTELMAGMPSPDAGLVAPAPTGGYEAKSIIPEKVQKPEPIDLGGEPITQEELDQWEPETAGLEPWQAEQAAKVPGWKVTPSTYSSELSFEKDGAMILQANPEAKAVLYLPNKNEGIEFATLEDAASFGTYPEDGMTPEDLQQAAVGAKEFLAEQKAKKATARWEQTDPQQWVYNAKLVDTPAGPSWDGDFIVEQLDNGKFVAYNAKTGLGGIPNEKTNTDQFDTVEEAQAAVEQFGTKFTEPGVADQQKAPIVSPGEITQPETSDIQQAQAQLPPGLTIVPETDAKGEPLFAAVSSGGTQAIWGTGKTRQELLDNTYAAMEQNPEMAQELGAAQPQGDVSEFKAAAAEVKAAYDSDHLIGINAEDKFDEFYGKGAYANFTFSGQLPTSLLEEAPNALPLSAGPETIAAAPAEGEGAQTVSEGKPGKKLDDIITGQAKGWKGVVLKTVDETGTKYHSFDADANYLGATDSFPADVAGVPVSDEGIGYFTNKSGKVEKELAALIPKQIKTDPIAEGLAALPAYTSPGALHKAADGLLSVVEASALHALQKHGSVTAALADPSVPAGGKNKLVSWESNPKFVEGLLKDLQLSGKFGAVMQPKQGKLTWTSDPAGVEWKADQVAPNNNYYRIRKTEYGYVPEIWRKFNGQFTWVAQDTLASLAEAKQLLENHYAQQNQIPAQPNGNVQQPEGPQVGQGQVPANEGGGGVSAGGQETQGNAVAAGYTITESPGGAYYTAPATYSGQINSGDFPTKQAAMQAAELDWQYNQGLLMWSEANDAIKALAKGEVVAEPAPALKAPSSRAVATELQKANLKKIEGALGSNAGGFYEDQNTGKQYYVKIPSKTEQALVEFTTSKFYELAGLPSIRYHLKTLDGKLAVVSERKPLTKAVAALKAGDVTALNKGFVIDAWLGNRDVIGQDYTNVQLAPDGTPTRLDFGGGLYFRAQGQEKTDWGPNAREFYTLRDPDVNPQSARAFSKITDKDLVEGAQLLAKITDRQIREVVGQSALKAGTAQVLIARRDYILARINGISSGMEVKALGDWVKHYDGTDKIEKGLKVGNPHDDIWAEVPKNNARYGVIVIDPGAGKVLIRKVKNDYDGYVWSWSKGKPNSGEHPVTAAKRETKEEMGYDTQLVGLLPTPFYSSTSTGALFYVGVAKGPVGPVGPESSSVKWVDYNEAKQLLGLSTNNLGRERDLQILDHVFGKAEVSDVAYYPIKKGGAHAKMYWESGQFKKDFPKGFGFTNKSWDELTQLQALTVASAARLVHEAGDTGTVTPAQVRAETTRVKANFKKWTGGHFTLSTVVGYNAKGGPDNPSGPLQTGKPVTLKTAHKTSAKGIVGDVIDIAKYGGTGIGGGADVKKAFFLFNNITHAKQGAQKVYELYTRFLNPLVVDEKGHSWSSYKFADYIDQAKAAGQDGVIVLNVQDMGLGKHTQIMVWDPNQIKTRELENTGYSLTDNIIYHAEATPPLAPLTRAQFSEAVAADPDLGPQWLAKAEKAGVVQLNETSQPNAPAGFFDPTTGKLTVNLDKLPAGENPLGVLFHEGGHQTWDAMLGPDLANKFRGEITGLAKQGNRAALDGTSRALSATADFYGIEHQLGALTGTELEKEARRVAELVNADPNARWRFEQEQIGYYLQSAKNLQLQGGLFRRIINAVKAWWVSSELGKAFAKAGLAPKLTDDLALAIVARGMKESVRLAERGKAEGKSVRLMDEREVVGEPGEPLTPEILHSALGTLTAIPLNVLDYLDPPAALTQNRRRQFRQWLQDSFIEGRDLERKAELIKGKSLPAKQRIYDLFTQVMPKATGMKLQQTNLYLDPMAKIAADNKFTAEDLNTVAYARTVEETNERGRLMLAKQWLHYIRDNEAGLKDQIMKDEKNLREQTRVPVLDAQGNQKIKNGKKVWRVDKKARQQGYYALFKKYHVLSSPDVFEELKPWDDKPSGMTDADARAVLNKWKNDPRSAAMDELFDLFDEMNRQVPVWFAESGMITIKMAKRWTQAYDHYATLHREGYETETKGSGAGFSPAKASGLRQFSPKLAVDVFANSIESFDRAIDLIHKNQFTTNFAEFVRQNPDAVKGMFKIKKHEEKPYLDEDGMIAFGFTKAMDKVRDAIFWEKGIPYLISAEANNEKAKAIIRAINNVDAPNLQGFLGAIAKATRFMATVNTSWSPEFFFVNPIRDLGAALINMSDSDAGKVKQGMLKNYKQMGLALNRVLKAQSRGTPLDMTDPDVQWVVEFQKNGGTTGWMDTYPNAEARRKAIEKRIDDLTPGVRPMKSLRAVGQFISDANAVAENVIRLSTYKALREAFPNEPVSKHIGIVKDLTVNFNRRGAAGPAINALYMFANASIQGSVRILQAIKNSKKVQKIVLSTIVVSALVDQLNRAMSQLGDDDDDKYDEIPDYVKERNIVLMTPWAGAVTIPAPWGYNAIWAVGRTISEAISAQMGDLPGWTAGKAGYDLAMTFFNAFNPISGGTLAQVVAPTILDPLAQIAENKTPFGETLRPELFPGQVKPESEQYWASASGFSKNATSWINWATGGDEVTSGWAEDLPVLGLLTNPHHMDAVLGQIFGATGRQLRDIGEVPFKAFGEDDMELRDFPIIRKFATFPTQAQSNAVYHDRVAQVLDVKRRLAAYSEGPRKDIEKARELRKSAAPLLRMVSYTDEAEKQLTSIRKRMRLAEGRGDAAAAKALKDRMDLLRQRYNTTWLRRVEG